MGGLMLREWLPQLFVSIFAFAFAVTGATVLGLDERHHDALEKKWSSWLSPHHGENDTSYQVARLPPPVYMSWGTFGFTALGGFYLAAAMAGFVHRTEA